MENYGEIDGHRGNSMGNLVKFIGTMSGNHGNIYREIIVNLGFGI